MIYGTGQAIFLSRKVSNFRVSFGVNGPAKLSKLRKMIFMGVVFDMLGVSLYMWDLFVPSRSLIDDVLLLNVNALAGFHFLFIFMLLKSLVSLIQSHNDSTANVETSQAQFKSEK